MERDGTGHARWGGILLGIGLGGFLDGIVLHQIVQWHHMLSTVLPPTSMEAMRTNMRWDGLFHVATWGFSLAGVFLLWRAARSRPLRLPTRWFVGLLLLVWGLFNLIEGLIDHHILDIHHVRRYAPDPVWDLGFLASGVALIAVGWWLARSGRRKAAGARLL